MAKENNSVITESTAEMDNMNIYQKIQTAKKLLSGENIKKSGLNKFSNFSYYELSDFMPSIIKIFDELKLFSKIVFTSEAAVLTIINAEKPDEQEEYTSPMKDLEIKGANAMQELGGVETYQRRYLYMSALDITENDMFDANSGKNETGCIDESNSPPSDAPVIDNPVSVKKLTEKQINRLHAIRKAVNMDEDTLRKILIKHYNKSASEELTKNEYDFICGQLEAMKNSA